MQMAGLGFFRPYGLMVYASLAFGLGQDLCFTGYGIGWWFMRQQVNGFQAIWYDGFENGYGSRFGGIMQVNGCRLYLFENGYMVFSLTVDSAGFLFETWRKKVLL